MYSLITQCEVTALGFLNDVHAVSYTHLDVYKRQEALLAESEDIAIVWGNIRYRNRRRFNAAFFAYRKQTHMRVKRNTPFTDDARYFEENPINSAIEFKGHVFALNFGREVQLTDININLDAAMYELDQTYSLKGNVIYANALGDVYKRQALCDLLQYPCRNHRFYSCK